MIRPWAAGYWCAAVLAAACLASAARAQDNAAASPSPPCRLMQIADLNMETEVSGHVSIPVKINRKDAMFMVDTGSVISSVSTALANELNMPQRPLTRYHAVFFGGVVVSQQARIESLEIGAAHGENADLLVDPPRLTDFDSDGLLGPDIMHQYDVELDFAGGKFNMFLPEQCHGDVAYWTKNAYAAVPMHVDGEWHITLGVTLDGKPVDAFVDTGFSGSVLTMEAAHRLFGLDEKSPGMVSLGDLHMNGSSGSTSYRYPFKTLSFGGVTVNNPRILLVSQSQLPGRGPQAIIGISVLRALHLYIGYKEEMLYVTPAVERPSPTAATPIRPPDPTIR